MRTMVLLLAFPWLAGCLAPEAAVPTRFAPGGDVRQPDGTFLLVEISGTLHERGEDLPWIACDRGEATGAIDVRTRSLAMPEWLLRSWRPNVTLVAWDHSQQFRSSHCENSRLAAPTPDLPLLVRSDARPSISLHAQTTGVTLGSSPGVLLAGVPYEYVLRWEEPDLHGGRRAYVADLVVTSHGVWRWDEVTASGGEATGVPLWT